MYDPAPELSYGPVHRPVLPVQRLGAALEVLICSGFPTQILLSVVLYGFGMSMLTADGRYSPPFVFTLSCLDAVLVIGLVIACLRSHGESVRTVLFGDGRIAREALLGIALLPALFMFVLLVLTMILRFAPQLHNVARNPLEDMLLTRSDAVMFGVVVMVAGGVREEVQRGFIVHRFGQYLGGSGAGVAIYSMAFGLGHVRQGLDAAIVTALLGACWGLLYIARRSIVAPMVSHAGFNIAQLVKHLVFAGG